MRLSDSWLKQGAKDGGSPISLPAAPNGNADARTAGRPNGDALLYVEAFEISLAVSAWPDRARIGPPCRLPRSVLRPGLVLFGPGSQPRLIGGATRSMTVQRKPSSI